MLASYQKHLPGKIYGALHFWGYSYLFAHLAIGALNSEHLFFGVVFATLTVLGVTGGCRMFRTACVLTNDYVWLKRVIWDRRIPLNAISQIGKEVWVNGEAGDCPVYVARDKRSRRLFILPYGYKGADLIVKLIQQRLASPESGAPNSSIAKVT